MRVRKTECLKKLELMEKRKGLVVPMPNKKNANRLSHNILNYFAAFTETRFNYFKFPNVEKIPATQSGLVKIYYRFCEWSWRGVNSWGK